MKVPQNVTKANYKKLTFSEMVTELHKVMWKINSSLKGAHPFASRPMSWPLLQRGIKYWNASVGTGQIYLIGNPIIWLLCAIGLALYVVHAVVMTVLDQRKIQILPLGMDAFSHRHCLNFVN